VVKKRLKIQKLTCLNYYLASEKKIMYFCLIMMKLFLITFGLLALAFAGIAIKILVKKDGEFAGTCASQSPFLNKDNEPCGFCGKLPDQQECKNPELAQQ
tara:strand:- start:255 stop:554 length:300 start_codon:yes stop_codon:yes gene_type:complete